MINIKRKILRLFMQTNTHNGNGYGTWVIRYNLFNKTGTIKLFTQSIGNGDNGNRCQ